MQRKICLGDETVHAIPTTERLLLSNTSSAFVAVSAQHRVAVYREYLGSEQAAGVDLCQIIWARLLARAPLLMD